MSEVDTLYFKSLSQVQNQTFDYIVLGGGAYGTSFTHRMLQLDANAKILVVEKGNYLIAEHIQNLPPTYVKLNTEVGIRPWKYTGDDKNLNFMPQIPYVGGRALFWNAWVPQPDKTEMPDWPEDAIKSLRPEWYEAGKFLGRRYSLKLPGNDNEALAAAMRNRLFAGLKEIDTATPMGDPRGLDSAMATGQNVPPEEWAKFSPITVLVEDIQAHPQRLAVVVNAEAHRLVATDGKITCIETTAGTINVGNAQVLLACNTLEAGFLMARSFPKNPLVGKNLSGHIRSWLALRVPVGEMPALTNQLQAIALYLSGRSTMGRLLHTHITVVHNPKPAESKDILYKILPDASTPQAVATYQDPKYAVIMLHTMGEFLGEPNADSWNYVGVDGEGNAIVHVTMRPQDQEFWKIMDTTTFQIANVLSNGAAVEYQHEDGSWQSTPPTSIHNHGLVHSAGTLWMGTDPETSVTNPRSQVHFLSNLYGAGSMVFPRPGSWNPTLTGVTQVFALARYLAANRQG
ncbi:MAG: GMC oxidoreductase [Calothrix sp. MO_192.B10]|nr:GMC oxidoreductase [Calothrix sp. MO_192.B10]